MGYDYVQETIMVQYNTYMYFQQATDRKYKEILLIKCYESLLHICPCIVPGPRIFGLKHINWTLTRDQVLKTSYEAWTRGSGTVFVLEPGRMQMHELQVEDYSYLTWIREYRSRLGITR